MQNRSHAVIAVSFLIVFAAGAALLFMWLAGGPAEPRIYRIVTTQAVGGIHAQSAVLFKGLTVGHVKRVRFDSKDRRKVVIRIGLRQHTYVTHATYAVLAFKGITGGKQIKLKLAQGASQKPLKTHADHPAQIPLHKSLLSKLVDRARKDEKKVSHVIGNVNKLMSNENRRHLSNAFAQIDTATRGLDRLERTLTPAVRALPGLLKTTRRTAAQIGQLAQTAQAPVRQAGPTEKSIRAFSRSGASAARKFDSATLPAVDQLARNLNRTADQLQQLSRELKRKPQSVVFGPPKSKPGPGEPGFKKR